MRKITDLIIGLVVGIVLAVIAFAISVRVFGNLAIVISIFAFALGLFATEAIIESDREDAFYQEFLREEC